MRWEYDRCLWKLESRLRRIRAEACRPVLLSSADRSDEAKACGNYCRALSLEAREEEKRHAWKSSELGSENYGKVQPAAEPLDLRSPFDGMVRADSRPTPTRPHSRCWLAKRPAHPSVAPRNMPRAS